MLVIFLLRWLLDGPFCAFFSLPSLLFVLIAKKSSYNSFYSASTGSLSIVPVDHIADKALSDAGMRLYCFVLSCLSLFSFPFPFGDRYPFSIGITAYQRLYVDQTNQYYRVVSMYTFLVSDYQYLEFWFRFRPAMYNLRLVGFADFSKPSIMITNTGQWQHV